MTMRCEIRPPRPRYRRWLFALLGLYGGAIGVMHYAEKPPRSSESWRSASTELNLRKLAFETYPQWAAEHPEDRCPRSSEQLREYINTADWARDAWGTPLYFACDKQLVVTSAGEDQVFGTTDDLRSNDERDDR